MLCSPCNIENHIATLVTAGRHMLTMPNNSAQIQAFALAGLNQLYRTVPIELASDTSKKWLAVVELVVSMWLSASSDADLRIQVCEFLRLNLSTASVPVQERLLDQLVTEWERTRVSVASTQQLDIAALLIATRWRTRNQQTQLDEDDDDDDDDNNNNNKEHTTQAAKKRVRIEPFESVLRRLAFTTAAANSYLLQSLPRLVPLLRVGVEDDCRLAFLLVEILTPALLATVPRPHLFAAIAALLPFVAKSPKKLDALHTSLKQLFDRLAQPAIADSVADLLSSALLHGILQPVDLSQVKLFSLIFLIIIYVRPKCLQDCNRRRAWSAG